MAFDIKMPKLGMTMEEGQIAEWIKSEKDNVGVGELVFIVESDKVTYEVESTEAGILSISIPEGEVVPVGTVIGHLAASEDEYAQIKDGATAAPVAEKAAEQPQPAAAEAPAPAAPVVAQPAQSSVDAKTGRVRATPGARSLAKKNNIDLYQVQGTGPKGRVTKDDVIKAIETPAAAAASAKPAAVSEAGKVLLKEVKMTGMRGTISRRMMESLQNAAQMTAFAEWDVTELMRLRKLINASEASLGYRASIPGMISYILARVLSELPLFNSSIDGNVIKYWESVNIGLAVSVDDGLVVPVLRDAHIKGLKQIQYDFADLIERARDKELTPEDMKGGTFTLSNVGSYGSDWETVILNPPEVALLGIGNITKKPVFIDDEIVGRQMMPISLTFDHRIIDGAAAGEFRQRMKQLIENPGFLITC